MDIRDLASSYWPWPQEKSLDSGYYGWGAIYTAVYLESDPGKRHKRIKVANSAMEGRLLELERRGDASSESKVIRHALGVLSRIAPRRNANHGKKIRAVTKKFAVHK